MAGGFGWLERIREDVRYALRAARRKPGFAATAVAILALAIAGNTVLFTVIRAVLLKPLPYRDAERLVRISGGATPERFAEMRAGARSFEAIAAFTFSENFTLTGGAEPEILRGVRISAGFPRVAGVEPLAGRGFREEEDAPGGAPVALLSAELWNRRFGGDPHIVGRTVSLAAANYTVIGVMPPGFRFPYPNLDVWLTAPAETPVIPARSRALSPYLTVYGRLRPGVSLARADAELKVLRRQYAQAYPARLDAKSKTPAELTPLRDELVADVRSMLWLLFGAVGLVLLIACANVASLLLARSIARSREFALRAALGAARRRLVGQLLAESVLLSLAGGALGLLLAAWAIRTIPAITIFKLPRAGEIRLDEAVLGFAAALSAFTGLLFGLAPALSASRTDLMAALRVGAPTPHARGWSAGGLLVAGQIALSLVLLTGAALLTESIARLRGIDIGFNPSRLLIAAVELPPLRYETPRKQNAFYRELAGRVKTLAGVTGVAAAWYLPMMGYAGTPVQDAASPPLKLNERPIATLMCVSPGYFQTLQIRLRRGREFTERDTEDAQRVAIIDENLARRLWPAYPGGPDPVGQRLLVGGVNRQPALIVGIAPHVRQGLETAAWPETVYTVFAQNASTAAMLAVRTTGDPLAYARAVREQVLTLDRAQPVAAVHSMDELVEAQVGQRRLLLMLLGAFSGVALLLAMIGIYGVMAHSVAQRTQEMGIRRALGAQHGDILKLVVRQGALLALAGIALGMIGAFALTRLMRGLLYGISATDPATFAGVAVLLLVVSLAASYVPARRATRIDPMAALRV